MAADLVDRPALLARLDEAFGKRLTSLVAGAGYGKTTLLRAWVEGIEHAWYTLGPRDARLPVLARGLARALRGGVHGLPEHLTALPDLSTVGSSEELLTAETFAGQLCESVEDAIAHDLVLVLDDVHELAPESASSRLLESLARQAPSNLHVVLGSRDEPPFAISRLRGRGEMLEFDASDLAFTEAEVAELAVLTLGPSAEGLAPLLHRATGGWPAELRLAVEALRPVTPARRADALDRLRRPEGPLFTYVADEVLAGETDDVRALLRRVACFDDVTSVLCEALGFRSAGATLDRLARRGLLVVPQGHDDDRFALHALLRDFILQRWPLTKREMRRLHGRAARWFAANGEPSEALRHSLAAADARTTALLLAEHGDELLWRGEGEAILRASETIRGALRDEHAALVVGEAHLMRGDWENALASFHAARAGSDATSPRIAHRIARIHFDRGEYSEALAAAATGRIDGSNLRDESLLLGLIAQTHHVLGDVDSWRALIPEQVAAATASGDPRALASAHNNLMLAAMAAGDEISVDEHYRLALTAAEASGSPLAVMRLRFDRADHLGGRAGLNELEPALQLAELAGAEVYLGVLLYQRGQLRGRLGLLDDAAADLRQATEILDRVGSNHVCRALAYLGHIHRDRGMNAQALAVYRRALDVAEACSNVQGVVEAAAGLARVLAKEQPEEADGLVTRALELARAFEIGLASALVDAGWVSLARNDRAHAERLAREADEALRVRREGPGLADVLELRALSAEEPRRETARLEEALAIWREAESPLGEARLQLALALVTGRGGQAAAQRARRTLRGAGVRVAAARLAGGPLGCLPLADDPPIGVRALGGFAVLRGGQPIALAEWRSKKARDLLQILVSRRGRPVPRDFLMEVLWPGEDPTRLRNRLSVALTALRGVLDPGRESAAEHFVRADRQAVALDLANVAVDVEEFLADAQAGLEQRARQLLADAEAAYAGDFLEEVYDDWAVSLREEARSRYIAVTRALAEDAARAEDHDATAGYLLRVLERDRFDERAHLELVRALSASGRHGDARRQYRAYAARMEEIGVEPASFPGATRAPAAPVPV